MSKKQHGPEYLEKWKKLYEPIEKLTGYQILGFDPRLTFFSPNKETVQITVDFAQKIIDSLPREN